MSKPLTVFLSHYDGLRNLLRAADIYTLHILAEMRNEAVNIDLVKKIISNKGNSTLIHTWEQYLSKDEYMKFKENGHIQELIQQIILSSYVAVEAYLRNTFKDILSAKLNNPALEEAILKRCSFQSLDKIKVHYKEILNIQLSTFDPNIGVLEEAWLRGNNCWEVIKNLSHVRNQIAHEGKYTEEDIFYLVDATSVIEFIYGWVHSFEFQIRKKQTLATCSDN